MASSVAKAGVKAIYAAPAFVPKGPISGGRFNLIREIFVGATLGVSAGLLWKTYHWSEKRKTAEYYAALDKREAEEEAAYTAELQTKLDALKGNLP